MIELKRAKKNQFYFRVKAKNGRVLVTSETYKSKASAWKAMESLENLMMGYFDIKDLT